ncbi:MAG: FAD-dependent oxidoreductase [Myxococcota bacterium]
MTNGGRVVIVGAGIAGAACARHLADQREVVWLERGGGPVAESTGHGVGMVRRLTDDPVERALGRVTRAWLGTRSDPHLTFPGAVVALAHDPTALNGAVAGVRAHGVDVRLGPAPPVCAGSAIRTWWWAPDEAMVDPRALATGLAREAVAAGATLHPGRAVTGLRRRAGRISGVDTDSGPIEADEVILAAGAWSGRLAATAGLDRPLVPLRRSVARVAAPAPAGHPWVWIDDDGLYLRPEAERGTWLVCPCDEAVDREADLRDTPSDRSRGPLTEAARALVADKLARWAPSLAAAPVVEGWSGLRTFTPDRRPLLGADADLPGLWWCAGLGGYGVTCGWAAAAAVTTWLTGGSVDWLAPSLVAPGRPMLGRFPIRPTGQAHRSVLITTR